MSLQQPSGIVTPEAVLLEFDTAGVGSRTAAELLDVLIQVTALGLMTLAAVFLAGAVGGGAGTVALIIMLIMAVVVIVGYPLAMESLWGGRTLGKAALGLRVVTVEGGPVRVRQSATRSIVGVFELWATFGSVAVLTTILTRDNQRLGDLLAGTLVLRERAAMSTTATAMSFPAPYGYADYVASIDVSVLTSDQYGVIRTFLMRVFDLTVEARGALAVNLANSTALALHHTPPSNVPPELFLVCVASAYQARHGGGVPAPSGWGGQPSPVPGVVGGPYAGFGPPPGPPSGYGPQPGYAPPPAYGQQPVYAPPPSSAPYPGSGPPVAPTGPPAAPAPSPQWAPPPVPSTPPRFDTPPTATPWSTDPVAPPRFDVPPTDPVLTPDAAPGSGPVGSADPGATVGAEPAPWPPRKPGRPPSSVSPASSASPVSTPDAAPGSGPVGSADPGATVGAEPAPWPPRKPGPHPSTLASDGGAAGAPDGAAVEGPDDDPPPASTD